MMAFIDGENLCHRWHNMSKEKQSSQSVITNNKEAGGCPIYVWHPETIQTPSHVILRATYYTSAKGDDVEIRNLRDKIRELTFNRQDFTSGLPNNLTPFVGKKKPDGRSKMVDIKMTLDILTHCYNDNLDTAYIVAGDADYCPIIDELLRHGKQVHLAFLSSGLSPDLRQMADVFTDLDAIYFPKIATVEPPAR